MDLSRQPKISLICRSVDLDNFTGSIERLITYLIQLCLCAHKECIPLKKEIAIIFDS